MKKRLNRFISTPLFCIALSFITSNANASAEVKTTMEKAAEELSTLIPLAYSDKAFRDEKERARIQQHLDSLDALFTKKASLLGSSSDTAWITLKVLEEHLSETKDLYAAGYFAMSQYLLTSTPAICATCHLQDSAHSSLKANLDRANFANDYSYAEYLFTIRNYDQASQFYLKHLQDPEVQNSRFRFLKPLERLLTIELGIRHSIPKAKTLLEKHHNKTLPIEIQKVISDWQSGLSAISGAGSKDSKTLEQYFNEWFSNAPNTQHEFIIDEQKRPQAIWLRAKLFDALRVSDNDSSTASVLYMLAVLDRVLGQSEPYSFANLYLKQCATRYPATKAARKCLDEYKNHLSFYYGGSAGEAVPEDLVNEYLEMKKRVDEAQ
ncbi:MAG: hypothetical protein MI867_09370 [Pseudomonadales bacterium]|nr:hypothetical protein [Pseudomonadales bacterium]